MDKGLKLKLQLKIGGAASVQQSARFFRSKCLDSKKYETFSKMSPAFVFVSKELQKRDSFLNVQL